MSIYVELLHSSQSIVSRDVRYNFIVPRALCSPLYCNNLFELSWSLVPLLPLPWMQSTHSLSLFLSCAFLLPSRNGASLIDWEVQWLQSFSVSWTHVQFFFRFLSLYLQLMNRWVGTEEKFVKVQSNAYILLMAKESRERERERERGRVGEEANRQRNKFFRATNELPTVPVSEWTRGWEWLSWQQCPACVQVTLAQWFWAVRWPCLLCVCVSVSLCVCVCVLCYLCVHLRPFRSWW